MRLVIQQGLQCNADSLIMCDQITHLQQDRPNSTSAAQRTEAWDETVHNSVFRKHLSLRVPSFVLQENDGTPTGSSSGHKECDVLFA